MSYSRSSRSIRVIWVSSSGGAGAPKQRPFAAILGCSDARVPIELIFNEGPNDLFVIRIAGNGLGTEVLGSLKYAVEHLGGTLKLIVVLGHSGCGAITTAVDVFLNPGDYLALATKHSLRSILDRSLLVVQASANKLNSVFGPDAAAQSGVPASADRGVDPHQCRALRLFDTTGVRDRRVDGNSGRLRRLPARDPRGMGATPR